MEKVSLKLKNQELEEQNKELLLTIEELKKRKNTIRSRHINAGAVVTSNDLELR